MLRKLAPGCREDDKSGNKDQNDKENEGLDVVGHMRDRQRVVNEVVEEHGGEVRHIDVEIEILQREFLWDN